MFVILVMYNSIIVGRFLFVPYVIKYQAASALLDRKASFIEKFGEQPSFRPLRLLNFSKNCN